MTGEYRTVVYGDATIAFSLHHADRGTLQIVVEPDSSVHVVAPVGSVYDDVSARVARRARWILRQQAYFERFSPRTPPRMYVSGESHLYLGRSYRLRVFSADQDGVRLKSGRFEVGTPDCSPERVRALLDAWYADKAQVRLRERLEFCWGRFSPDGRADAPSLRIARLKSRWGSMSPTGRLTLNVDLIRAPRECIDYVIVHELCHLKHPDHGPKFRAKLEDALPDWRQRKHRLELTLS